MKNYCIIPAFVVSDIRFLNLDGYENYLISMLTLKDLEYLGRTNGMKLVRLGIRSNCLHLLPEEEFNFRKHRVQRELFSKYRSRIKPVMCPDISIPDPLLRALAERENNNIERKILSIIYLKDYTPHGDEISSYIDFRHSLKRQNWKAIFEGTKVLKITSKDLSHYHWSSGFVQTNETDNFKVVNGIHSMAFLCKLDMHEVVPDKQPGLNNQRFKIATKLFSEAVIYDHVLFKFVPYK